VSFPAARPFANSLRRVVVASAALSKRLLESPEGDTSTLEE
jgi:hypothetical protein